MLKKNTFSDKQNTLIEIFAKLAEYSNKYKSYYFYLKQFSITPETEKDLEEMLNNAIKGVKDFNLGFEGNIAILKYRLQKLKSKKMEDIDTIREIEKISALLKKLEKNKK